MTKYKSALYRGLEYWNYDLEDAGRKASAGALQLLSDVRESLHKKCDVIRDFPMNRLDPLWYSELPVLEDAVFHDQASTVVLEYYRSPHDPRERAPPTHPSVERVRVYEHYPGDESSDLLSELMRSHPGLDWEFEEYGKRILTPRYQPLTRRRSQ